MKTFSTTFILTFLLVTGSLFAQYPIPSLNVTIEGKATFQEQENNAPDQPMAKRTLHVRITCIGSEPENCSATVWVYSLDGTDTYGPFTVNGGETLDVEIDEREWGTMVQSDNPVTVDVWIDAGGLILRRR